MFMVCMLIKTVLLFRHNALLKKKFQKKSYIYADAVMCEIFCIDFSNIGLTEENAKKVNMLATFSFHHTSQIVTSERV